MEITLCPKVVRNSCKGLERRTKLTHASLLAIYGHNYLIAIKKYGGNQYKAPHSRLRKMGKDEDTAVNLKYDEKLYLAAQKIAESDSNL